MIFPRKSIGSPARIGCKGNSNSSALVVGACASTVPTEWDCGDACGCDNADTEKDGGGVWGRVLGTSGKSLSSTRRSNPRSSPANFVFTMLDIGTLAFLSKLSTDFHGEFEQETCQRSLFLFAFGCVRIGDVPMKNLSRHWTDLSLVFTASETI